MKKPSLTPLIETIIETYEILHPDDYEVMTVGQEQEQTDTTKMDGMRRILNAASLLDEAKEENRETESQQLAAIAEATTELEAHEQDLLFNTLVDVLNRCIHLARNISEDDSAYKAQSMINRLLSSGVADTEVKNKLSEKIDRFLGEMDSYFLNERIALQVSLQQLSETTQILTEAIKAKDLSIEAGNINYEQLLHKYQNLEALFKESEEDVHRLESDKQRFEKELDTVYQANSEHNSQLHSMTAALEQQIKMSEELSNKNRVLQEKLSKYQNEFQRLNDQLAIVNNDNAEWAQITKSQKEELEKQRGIVQTLGESTRQQNIALIEMRNENIELIQQISAQSETKKLLEQQIKANSQLELSNQRIIKNLKKGKEVHHSTAAQLEKAEKKIIALNQQISTLEQNLLKAKEDNVDPHLLPTQNQLKAEQDKNAKLSLANKQLIAAQSSRFLGMSQTKKSKPSAVSTLPKLVSQ